MTRAWASTGPFKGIIIEEYVYSDGSVHYSIKDNTGTHNLSKQQAEKTLNNKLFSFVDITKKMMESGWIRHDN